MQQYNMNKLWNGPYILTLILSAMTGIGFNMIMPILAKYVVHLGASMTLAGVIAGIFSLTALFARPFAGFSSDRFDKKKLLILSTAVLAVSTLGYGLTSNVYVLLVFRIIHGIAFSFSGTASMALGTSFIPKERMGEGIGFMGLSYILATAVGPNIGIQISGHFGYTYVFYAAFGVLALASALMNLIPGDPFRKKASDSKGLKLKAGNLIAKELLIFTVVIGFFSLMNGLISSFLVLLGDEKGIANIGYYFTVNALVLVFIRPLSGKLLDKMGYKFIVFPAYAFAIVAALLLASSSALWMVLLAGALYAVGHGSAQPAIQTTCIKRLGPERSGVATSTFFIGADVGQGLGPIIGGAVAASFGFSSVFYGGAAMLFMGMLILYIYTRVTRSKAKSPDAVTP